VSLYRKRRLLVPVAIGMSFFFALAAILIGFQSLMPKSARAASSAGLSPQVNNIPASWVARPSFAGKVLHWAQTNYNYTPNGPDPANGKAINGDIWVVVGSDGLPISIRARYTLSDGTFLQEFVQTRQGATFFFSPTYHMPTGCSVDNKASSTNALLSALPRFVQESLLPAHNYARVNKRLSYSLPITVSLDKVTALQTYSVGASVYSWFFSDTLTSGMKESDALDVSTDGRLLAEEVKVFDAQGSLIQDSWHTYGQLQVYNSSDIPSTISALTQKGGCHA